ncbi:tetratricopeptide repeat protein [bacterium]|nr:tetratricopeptide repeat protein [bacterium]
MQKRISNELLSELSKYVTVNMGLYFPKGRWLDLLRGFQAAVKEFGTEDIEDCIHSLLSAPPKKRQVEILARHLTVGETYFFREPKVFEALEKKILPELIRSRWETEKRLRIWSAACCTGEEAYSIAILLTRLIPDLKDWNITILATDINPHFLAKAAEGVYREWSFRGIPYWLKENYFRLTAESGYEIAPHIKRMVQFQYLNLVEDVYPSLYNDTNAMDIIFCRNVLMYFSTAQVKKVIDRMHHCLLDSGHLIVASSETSHLFYPQFITLNYPGSIFYRKDLQAVAEKKKFANFYPDRSGEIVVPEQSPVIWESRAPSPKIDEDKPGSTFVEDYQSRVPRGKAQESPALPDSFAAGELPSVQTSPVDDNAMKEMETLYERGSYDEIVAILQKRATDTEKNVHALTLLAKSYANQGKLQDALHWCEKAIHLEKLNPKCYHLRAVILQEQGKVADAVDSLKRALYLDPNYALAYFMLGNLMKQTGKSKEGNKYLQNALHILGSHDHEAVLPESEGITVGRLKELIQIMVNGENPA